MGVEGLSVGQRGGLVFMCLMSGVLCAGIRHSCATSSSSMDGANMHSGASLRMAPPICSTEAVRVLPPTRRALQFAAVSNLVVSPTSTWRFTSVHSLYMSWQQHCSQCGHVLRAYLRARALVDTRAYFPLQLVTTIRRGPSPGAGRVRDHIKLSTFCFFFALISQYMS